MSRFSIARLVKRFGSTEKLVVVAVLVWLGLLALGSTLVALPFVDQAPNAAPNWSSTMYLHGLLIGMVGLLGLIAMDVFQAGHRSPLMHKLVLWGTLGAALFSGVGGIFDHAVTDTVFLWMQIVSFFFLDEILLTLTIALLLRAAETHRVAAWAASFGAMGGFLAAVMGHAAGWMLEMGDWPKIFVSGYAALAGDTWQTLETNLISGHAHLMVLSVIALVVASIVEYFTQAKSGTRLMRFGLWWMAAGTLAVMVIYVVAGFSQVQPPVWFVHAGSGIPGDDLTSGLTLMLGAVLALVGLGLDRLPDATARWGAAILSLLTLITVPVVGYYIELNENLYNHGVAGAAGSASDAIFSWFHQDFALFMIPGLLLLVLVLQRFAASSPKRPHALRLIIAGSIVLFFGGLLYVFFYPQDFGPAFYVSVVGLASLLAGLIVAIWAVATTSETSQPETPNTVSPEPTTIKVS